MYSKNISDKERIMIMTQNKENKERKKNLTALLVFTAVLCAIVIVFFLVAYFLVENKTKKLDESQTKLNESQNKLNESQKKIDNLPEFSKDKEGNLKIKFQNSEYEIANTNITKPVPISDKTPIKTLDNNAEPIERIIGVCIKSVDRSPAQNDNIDLFQQIKNSVSEQNIEQTKTQVENLLPINNNTEELKSLTDNAFTKAKDFFIK